MVLLAIGGLLATMALGCLILAAVYGLAHFVQPWAAALLVALGVGAIGGLLRMEVRRPIPHCAPALSSTAPTDPRCSRWAPRISR